jgi:protein-tyrosine phosphatase
MTWLAWKLSLKQAYPRVREIKLMNQPGPIPDSYWVTDNFLAGEYPGSRHKAEAREKLQAFLKAGINFFLDLTEKVERNVALKPYEDLLLEEAARSGRAVEYKRMPIRDVEVPTPALMTEILDTIDAALAAGKKVYIHCWGGVGRTGTVVGCYLVRHGMPGEEALHKIAELRKGTPDGWKTAPQTTAQRQMVLDWRK